MIYEIRNAGGVLLGWHESEAIARECAAERAAEFNIDVTVREVEKSDEHDESTIAVPDRELPR